VDDVVGTLGTRRTTVRTHTRTKLNFGQLGPFRGIVMTPRAGGERRFMLARSVRAWLDARNQWLCMDRCDRRAPVRDLYTPRLGEVYVGRSAVCCGGAIIPPDCPGARRAGSGDCALACDVASAAMLPARMKEAIRFRVIGGSFQEGYRSFAGLSSAT
jgi:hypothetical protein